MCVMMLSKATQNIYFTKLMFISVWCHVIIPKKEKTKGGEKYGTVVIVMVEVHITMKQTRIIFRCLYKRFLYMV